MGERFGAEPVLLGERTQVVACRRPPATAEEALLLAWEHSLYCFEVDHVGLVGYARELYAGKAWSFWWD